MTQSGINVMAGIFLLTALMASHNTYAGIGFNGAFITSSGTTCSGAQATFTFTPTTCANGNPDFTATYFIDSSHDAGSSWFTPSGTTTGTINASSGPLIYTTPVLIPTSPDVIYYRVRLTGITNNCSGPGTTFTSLTVTVNLFPQPGPIIGPSSHNICVGSSISLNDLTAGGTWSSSSSGIASVDGSGNVSGNAPGTATIVYSLAGGCASTYPVTVNPAAPTISGPVSVCVGSTGTYTLSAPATGTWGSSSPAVGTVSSTGVFTAGSTIGTTMLTFTVTSTSCFSTFLVSVNPIPAPISCIPSSPICEGTSFLLCDATSGGTYSGGDIFIATVDPGGNVLGMGGGTTTVTYTVGGCSTTAVVSVNDRPAFITGPSSVCIGQTITLSSSGGNVWTGDNPPVATVGSGLGDVHGLSAGVVHVTYTNTTTGCFRTTTVTVGALPEPITGPDSVCVGSTVTLSDATPGGSWSSSIPPIASISSAGVVTTGVTSGTTTISYSIPGGCTITVELTVNPVPIPSNGIGAICPGETVLLTNSSFGTGTWSSSNPSIATVGVTSGILTGVAGGIVGITYTLSTGCFVVDLETVNPAPAPIAGIPNTCVGFTTHLSDLTGGGTWTSSNTAIGTVDGSGNVTGISPGLTTIVYTLPTGCTTSVVVTVDGTPAPIIGPFTVCEGPLNTITLSHPVPGGTWSSSDPFIAPISLGSGLVTGLHVGTATIVYTLASGCSVAAVVTVNPVPPANTGTLYLCAGSTTSLSNSVGGGTWSSENTAIATVGSSTGVVSGISGGTTHISYTLQGGCSAVSVVTVYALPAILGTPLVCPGSSIALNGVPGGGFWTSLVPAIASVGSLSGIVTGNAEGTTTLTYTLVNTCYTTAVVTVQPLPNPTTGINNVCVGLTTTLSNSTVGGGTWMSSDTSIAKVDTNTGVVTGISAGVVSIIFTATSTGCTVAYSVTVNPLPLAIFGPTEVCVNDSIHLSDPSPGGTWSSSGIYATANSTTGWVTGVSAGVETIVYTLPTGCITTYQVTVNPLPSPILGPTAVCYGNTISLSSAPPGGVWSIIPASGIASINAATGDLTADGTPTGGVVEVLYTIFPTGCSATAFVTVNPLPAPITGELNICLHASTVLHDAVPGGTWTSDNILIAVIDPDDGTLASVTAGTVGITYTLPTGCYITAIETINPTPPPILGTLELCMGSSSTLFDVTTGGSWSSSDVGIATIGSADGIVTAVGVGTAFITYTLPSSCPRVAIVTVNANPNFITGITSICQGTTTTLHDVTPGGTWSSSNSTIAPVIMTTGVVFGLELGSATITYMLPTGCYTTIDVQVNPVPQASDITTNRRMCVGDIRTFTDPVNPLGTWSVSSTTPGVVAIVSPAGGIIQAVAPGTAIVSYTLPTGCATFIVITVDALPTISGPGALCAGGNNITLIGSPGGGTWISTNTVVATIGSSTGVVTSGTPSTTIPMTTTIIYTAPGTGCQTTKVITVNPNPNPITGFSTVCLGSTITIGTTTTGGTWSNLNPTVVSITTIPGHPDSVLVNGLNVGVATLKYTLSTGCFVAFNVTVNPLPLPITGPNKVCVGSSITLSDPTPGGTWRISTTTTTVTVDTLSGVVTGVSAGTAIVTYKLSTGCYSTYQITVNPLPLPIYGNNSICVGFTTALHDTTSTGSAAVGSWSSVNPGVGTISSTGVFTGLTAGVAVIHFTFSTGCFASYTVTVHPIPTVTIVTQPDMICRHSSVGIRVTGADTYTWAPPVGLSATTGDTVTASPLLTTTYTVTGTTVYGCSDTAVVTVVVDTLLNHINITGKDTICKGDSTVLIASGRDQTFFHWRPATGLSCTICDTVIAYPIVTTTYNALAIDNFGCRDSLDVTITVMPLPKLVVTPNPVIVCRGSSTQLHVIDTAALAGTTTQFAWFPNAFISCDTCANPFVTDTFNLIYRVTGITQFGCIDSVKVPVSVLDSAFNSINKDTTICQGMSAQLYASSVNPDGARSTFYWLNSDGTMTNRFIPNPVVTPQATETYSLIVTPNVCWPDTLYTTVQVVPYPDITITPPSATVAAGTQVALTASVGNDIVIQNYSWSPPYAISCDTCYHTIVTPSVTTTYTFTATSIHGCTSSADVTIHIFCESSEVFIPNTFTPNGDGMNDRFYVSGKGISTITKMQIFNRWGELVYEAHNIMPNDASVGWDGQYKGIVLEPDVFVYIIEATCNLGEHFTYKGDISIVR